MSHSPNLELFALYYTQTGGMSLDGYIDWLRERNVEVQQALAVLHGLADHQGERMVINLAQRGLHEALEN